MTPGPNKILKIPATGSLIKIWTIGSGNTIGARWWTDGKMDAPMLPDNPWLRRNPETGETFWIDECDEVASEDSLGDSKYTDVPFAGDANEDDLLEQLASDSQTTDKQLYLRTRLWWGWNDSGRTGETAGDRPAGFDANLRMIVDFFDDADEYSRLMTAEALRELGEHERVAELLDHAFSSDLQMVADVIRGANAERKIDVLEIVSTADEDDVETASI